MKFGTSAVRAAVAALLIAVAIGALPNVAAQESPDDPAASAWVDVSCWTEADGSSTCTFTPSGDVSWLSVPDGILCAPVIASGSASWGTDGLGQAIAGNSIILTFDGAVSAGGAGNYAGAIAGVPATIGGAGIVCGASSATVPSIDEVDDPTEIPSEPTTVLEVSGTPTSGDPVDHVEDVPTVVVNDEPEVTEPQPVSITVGAYDCAVDPGAADPSSVSSCSPSSGVSVAGTADGTDIGTQTTDGSGFASFSALPGTALVFTEDASTVPAGYVQSGNGTVGGTAAEGLTLVFVHIGNGRLQIVAGSCPTAGETRTEFRVIEPKSISAQAAPACAVQDGATFTVSGAGLGGDLIVTTGSDGAWRGFLPAGTYTVTDDSGAAAEVTIAIDDISVVIAVDYVSAPLGVVNVSRFACKNQDSGGVAIDLSGNRPAYRDDVDCTTSTGDVTIDVQAEVTTQAAASFSLGPDGVEEVELPSGSYVITDVATGKIQRFDLSAGTRVYLAIVDRIVGGNGVGGGGGDDGGGSDGTGNPGGMTPTPVSGGGDGGSSNGDGTDVDSGSTDGGTDTGAPAAGAGTDELSGVTTLPATGSRSNGATEAPLLVLLLIAGLAGTAGAVYAARRRAA